MVFKLPDHVMERLSAERTADAGYAAAFAKLNDKDLAAAAHFWMANCDAPRRHMPGAPIYDSTFWHNIVPEILRRLEAR